MTNTVIEANFRFERSDHCTMDGFLDDVVEHLGELNKQGVYILADTTRNAFTLGLTVTAVGDPVTTGLAAMRTAFHACDAMTDGWPTNDQAQDCVRVVTEKVEMVPA